MLDSLCYSYPEIIFVYNLEIAKVRLQISQYLHRSHLKVMGQEQYPLLFHKEALRLQC